MTVVFGVRGTTVVVLSGGFAEGELPLLELPLRTLLARLMNLERPCLSSDGPPVLGTGLLIVCEMIGDILS